MRCIFVLLTMLILMLSSVSSGFAQHTLSLNNVIQRYPTTIILVIRHAEMPEEGNGLNRAGQMRAEMYVQYFKHYQVNGRNIHLNALFAAQDSENSIRPRLTLTPLSQALGLPIQTPYKNKHYLKLVDSLKPIVTGKTILISWHHGTMPGLLAALGADPKTLLPQGKWPNNQFGWVIQLCYDKDGHLIPELTRRVEENLQVEGL